MTTADIDRGPRPRLLALDDDEQVRTMLDRVLRGAGYDCETVADLTSARTRLLAQRFDLVLCDITLSGESGLDLLREIGRDLLHVAVVMVTAVDDPAVASVALSLGADGYLVKPFGANELLIQVDGALRRRELDRVRRFHVEELENKLLDRSVSLRTAFDHLQEVEPEVGRAHRETAERLTAALSLRDEETGGHIERVGRSAVLLALRAGITEWPDEDLLVAAMLHDVGKIAVPDLVLLKPGPLSAAENATMRRHADAGHRLLDGAVSRMLRLGASVALTHHERWDGTGYPRGLAGEDIPIEGRLVAIADTFDAMTSNRVYRPRMEPGVAIDLIRAEAGRQLDPELVAVFLGSADEFVSLRQSISEDAAAEHPVRVLLVDDHTMFAETTVRLLDRMAGLAVVGRERSVADAVARSAVSQVDVVVSEWSLPDGTAADLARRVRATNPETACVVLTETWDDAILVDALDAGCAGCVGKHRTFDDLTAAIHAAAAGDALVPPGQLVRLLRRLRPRPVPGDGALDDRGREILRLLADGLSPDAIAERLHISPALARQDTEDVIGKLGAHSRLEAVAVGVRAGLLSG